MYIPNYGLFGPSVQPRCLDKHLQTKIYIKVCLLIYLLWSKCYSEGFFYQPMGRGVARREPTHVTPKVKFYMHTIYQVCRSEVLLAEVPFLALFAPNMKTKVGVVI